MTAVYTLLFTNTFFTISSSLQKKSMYKYVWFYLIAETDTESGNMYTPVLENAQFVAWE